jgi:hypothetical protein
MKRLPKDEADKMVMDVLVSLSKQDNISSEFAQNSIDIINNEYDNQVFTGILLTKVNPSILDKNEINIKTTVISALQTVFDCCIKDNDFIFNNDLAKEFSVDDINKSANSSKLHFSLNQFAVAFYEYERLEKKYPELMKFM